VKCRTGANAENINNINKELLMSSYVIPPPTQSNLPVVGTDKLFPIRRVYCVGRNYAEHTREMGHDPNKEAPFFFMKTPDSLFTDGKFPYPTVSTDVHWEIEMVVALKSGGKNIKAADALSHVFGYAIALDMTRRDLQGEAKKTGRPWEIGKAFDHSTPCTPLSPVETVGHLARGAITLDLNGVRKQTGDLSDMIWDVPSQIEYLSTLWELKAGDLILTGTPAGVGAVKKGDHLKGHVQGLGDLDVTVV
jgi:fumarylpyruvate hydrolase